MKRKITFVRLIAIVMVMITMLSIFASCAQTGNEDSTSAPINNQETAAPSGDETTGDPTIDKDGYKIDNIPQLNYNTEINILAWSDVEHEEFDIAYEDLSGDIVEQSLYDRNSKVEQRLGVTLVFNRNSKGNADNIPAWNSYISTSVSVNAREFDIIAGYSLAQAQAAVNGYLFNLIDEECVYQDFDQPWWSELLLKQATFGDALYFASGDISRNALEMMYVCYVNTDLLEEFHIENPQSLVEPGDWTYEKFIELCQGVYRDDGDNIKNCTKDTGDTFGYITAGIHVDPWFYGTGASICERNADGKIIESPSFTGERVANTVDMLTTFLESQFAIYTFDEKGKSAVYHQHAFGQGRSLFMMDRARVSHKTLATYYGDTKFAILPCPKYDKDQEDYITVMGNPFTLYAVAADIANPEMASAFIECFASEGYRKVTPAVFELSLKTRYVDDPISASMYDIIRANVTYDIGRIFSESLIKQSTFRDAIQKDYTWGSVAVAAARGLDKALPRLNKALFK
jgi:ABC-type glycerol-3-phosphate transport system substrate-binding protein